MTAPKTNRPTAGGLALLGGVSMTVGDTTSAAVRLSDGTIATNTFARTAKACSWQKVPFVRGLFIGSGLKGSVTSMRWAIAKQEPEHAASIERKSIKAILLLSIGAIVTLFAVLPSVIAHSFTHGGAEVAVEALIRFALLLGYLVAVHGYRPIKEVFSYHGAEHKTVAAYEMVGTPDDLATQARSFSRYHPRCGTTLVFMALLFTSIATAFFYKLPSHASVLIRPALFLVGVSAGYEVTRFCAPRMDRAWARAAMWPGLQLQRLTTAEPSDEQLEVAARALREACSNAGAPANAPRLAALSVAGSADL